jgi:hypothetical protein
VETLFRDRLESTAARGVPDRRLELQLGGYERLAPALEIPEYSRLREPLGPPPDDARGHEDETNEHDREEPAAPRAYAAFRHARSFALRERGLRAISSAVGVIALRITSCPSR